MGVVIVESGYEQGTPGIYDGISRVSFKFANRINDVVFNANVTDRRWSPR